MNDDTLMAISPLDGRYHEKCKALQPIFSEYGFFKARIHIEVEWLKALAAHQDIHEVEPLSSVATQALDAILSTFDLHAAKRIKELEQTTRHDVKAVEYYIRERMAAVKGLERATPFVHFACTSEDINNLSYALMIKQGRSQVLMTMKQLLHKIQNMAHSYADIAMLSRTHGQAATPTTMGKEFANVAQRIQIAIHDIESVTIYGKINGAVGNFNAHHVAYPEINWPVFGERLVTSLGLSYNPLTTQIEPHDWVAKLLDAMARLNTILIDLCRDIWAYISIHYFNQKITTHETGSSTMPHKVNPIDFENAEGNFGMSIAVARFMCEKLPISRWQRDLTDSTVMRNIGVVFGHAAIGYESLLIGLSKIEVNEHVLAHDLHQHWEVLAEPIQTVMRRYGIDNAYEQLKDLTRHGDVTEDKIHAFIKELPIPQQPKQVLLALKPATYTGYAEHLVKEYLK